MRRGEDLVAGFGADPAVFIVAVGEGDAGYLRGRDGVRGSGDGLRGADALTVQGTTVRDRDGRAWNVEVEEQVGSDRPTSCGALALPSVSLRATAVIPSAARPVCSTPA